MDPSLSVAVIRGAFPFVIRLADGQGPTPGVHTTITRSGVVPMDYSLTRFDRVWLPRANWLSDDASIDDAGNFSDPTENRDKRLLRSVSTVQNVWAGMSGALAAVSTVAAACALHFSTRRRPTQHRPLFGCLTDAMAISCLASAARSARVELIAAWRRGERASAPRVGTMTWAPWAPVNSELAMAKVMAAWTTERVTAECRLRCGVLGALAASRYLDYQGLGHMLNAGGGDNLIVLDTARDLVARAVELPEMALTDKALWRELNRRRVFFLARRTAEAVAQGPAAEDSFDARIDPALDELTRSLIPYTADLVEAFAADGFLAHSPLLADDYVQAVGATGIG